MDSAARPGYAPRFNLGGSARGVEKRGRLPSPRAWRGAAGTAGLSASERT